MYLCIYEEGPLDSCGMLHMLWDVLKTSSYYNVDLVKSVRIIIELFYDPFFLFVVCIQDHRCDI